MTKQLEKAFSEANKLPLKEQNSLARWLLEELASERRWSEQFARSRPQMAAMAKAALAEHRPGKSKDLDLRDL
jgi:hypothetical protein